MSATREIEIASVDSPARAADPYPLHRKLRDEAHSTPGKVGRSLGPQHPLLELRP